MEYLKLPTEISCKIISYLNHYDRASLSESCKLARDQVELCNRIDVQNIFEGNSSSIIPPHAVDSHLPLVNLINNQPVNIYNEIFTFIINTCLKIDRDDDSNYLQVFNYLPDFKKTTIYAVVFLKLFTNLEVNPDKVSNFYKQRICIYLTHPLKKLIRLQTFIDNTDKWDYLNVFNSIEISLKKLSNVNTIYQYLSENGVNKRIVNNNNNNNNIEPVQNITQLVESTNKSEKLRTYLQEHPSEANLTYVAGKITAPNNGLTPLHYVCKHLDLQSLDNIQILIDFKANVNAVFGADQETPLHTIIKGKAGAKIIPIKLQAIKMLIDAGANFRQPNAQGQTPEQLAKSSKIKNEFVALLPEWARSSSNNNNNNLKRTISMSNNPNKRQKKE